MEATLLSAVEKRSREQRGQAPVQRHREGDGVQAAGGARAASEHQQSLKLSNSSSITFLTHLRIF